VDGGTIFLDEVGETSLAMQQRLLRVLQEGEIRRVGGVGTRRVDVRVGPPPTPISRPTAAGRFRRDLYYRLNVFPIHLPPLRERAEDIPALADHRRAARRPANGRGEAVPRSGSAPALCAYPVAGQRARAENEIERAVALADDGHPLAPPHLSERIVGGAGGAAVPALRTLNEAVEALKRRMIEDALRECGSKTRAAERLGLTRQSLQQMLRRRQP
jgi:transcriptional regulator with PAS, ATPase and Fis domain